MHMIAFAKSVGISSRIAHISGSLFYSSLTMIDCGYFSSFHGLKVIFHFALDLRYTSRYHQVEAYPRSSIPLLRMEKGREVSTSSMPHVN